MITSNVNKGFGNVEVYLDLSSYSLRLRDITALISHTISHDLASNDPIKFVSKSHNPITLDLYYSL